MAKDVLGHINCSVCGTAKGVRITRDKNGDPFGFCEARCRQQLKIGGCKSRVADFIALYPWAAYSVPGTGTATVTEPVQKDEPVQIPVFVPPVPAPAKPVAKVDPAPPAPPLPAKKRATWFSPVLGGQ